MTRGQARQLDLVTMTQANEEAYATMIMGYQKDLDFNATNN